MKELVMSIAQDYISWIAIGIGFGIGLIIILKEKSFGKAIGIFMGCVVFSFICWYPEIVLSKVYDFMSWAINKIKI